MIDGAVAEESEIVGWNAADGLNELAITERVEAVSLK